MSLEELAALRAALDGLPEIAGIDYERHLKNVDLSDLQHAAPPPIDYAVAPLLPRRYVTLLSGHGGTGKSMLALTWAAHIPTGRDWAGLPVAKLPAVFISLEDEGDLVRYRLKKIIEQYGLDYRDVSEGLRIYDGTDNPVLAAVANDFGSKTLIPTLAMKEMEDIADGAAVIFIDNASDSLNADANDPALVRAFLRMLIRVARKNNAAVCLLSHIDKQSARFGSAGNSYIGTTAWHNSARSRLAMIPAEDGGVELRQEKLNLGKPAAPIALEWDDRGILRPALPGITSDDEFEVLKAIRSAIANGATVNTTIGSAYSAAKCLDPYLPPGFTGSRGKRRVDRAIVGLSSGGKIRREKYRTDNRKDRERWVLAQESAPE